MLCVGYMLLCSQQQDTPKNPHKFEILRNTSHFAIHLALGGVRLQDKPRRYASRCPETKFSLEILEERENLEALSVDGRLVLKRIIK
jgi:hypothetical protein